MTTIRDMIVHLEELADEHGEDVELLVTHQANYPLQEVVAGTWVSGSSHVCPECEEGFMIVEALATHLVADHDYDAADIDTDEQPKIAYLVLGGHPHDHSPYGPRDAFNDYERI
jgi:hypothetical protein